MRRKTLKVDPETKTRLEQEKRDGETWDGCLKRLAERDGRLSDSEVERVAEATAEKVKPVWWPW